MSQWPRRTVGKSGDNVLKPGGEVPAGGGEETFPTALHKESTLTEAANIRSVEQLLSLSTSPQALLLLSYKYLNTEEARPFLLSDEVEEVMARFSGVPDAVRRTAALVVILGRFHDSNSGSEANSLPGGAPTGS